MPLKSNTPVMDRLREATWDLHMATESHPFQCALGGGTLPRKLYVQYLSQLFLVHRALEKNLLSWQEKRNGWTSVLHEYHYQESCLRGDLVFLGQQPESVSASPSTQQVIDRINRAGVHTPIALLGFFYVLEGSSNGARFLAKTVVKAYNLPGKSGTGYLDRHGDKQRERWLQFKQDMNGLDFPEADIELMVESAKLMFAAFGQICTDLMSSP